MRGYTKNFLRPGKRKPPSQRTKILSLGNIYYNTKSLLSCINFELRWIATQFVLTEVDEVQTEENKQVAVQITEE